MRCRIFWFSILLVGLIGCLQEGGNGSANPSGAGVLDAGDPPTTCILDADCEEGFVCVAQNCVLAAESQDGGISENKTDAGVETPLGNPWLLSVNGSTKTLVKIDTVTGQYTTVCTFSTEYAGYPSTTFGLNGTLYGWNGNDNSLDEIDPCTCEVTTVGVTQNETGFIYTHMPGITADGHKTETLFGLSTDPDELTELSVDTGEARFIGALGVDFDFAGTSWSVELDGLYAINKATDELYEVNTESGLATSVADLDIDFHYVGIEYNIRDNNLYACTNPGNSTYSNLYRVNVTDGTTTNLGSLGYRCNNLASPWTPVACIEEIDFEEETPPEF